MSGVVNTSTAEPSVGRALANGVLWRGVLFGFLATTATFAVVFFAIRASVGATSQSKAQPQVAAAAIALVGTLMIGLLSAIVTYFGHLVTRQNAQLASETSRLQAALLDKNAAAANVINRENALMSARLGINSKLADLRQSWINSLRDDMAEYQAIGVVGKKTDEVEQDFFSRMVRIELCMNPEDPLYPELHDTLYAYINGDRQRDWDHWDDRLTAVCQKILKTEWEVLKDGLASVIEEQAAALAAARELVPPT